VLASACTALKLFPLRAVLLPRAPLPLHVFEPRYRALVAAALDGDRALCVPMLEDLEEALAPRARVRPVAGAGLIAGHRKNADGTWEIVVHGVSRVRLLEELERGAPYREWRAEPLPDRYPAGGAEALAGEVEALGQLVYELSALLPPESGAGQLVELVARLHDPGALADLVAAAAVSEAGARQRVLEALDVSERLALVKEEVASTVLLLSRGRTPSA
jgi:hypothetical protein